MRVWPALLMLLVPLSGCLVEDAANDEAGFVPGSADRPEPQRTEGQVTVEFEPNRLAYVARQEIRIENTVPPQARFHLDAQTENGDIRIHDEPERFYRATASLWAAGSTEAEAREHLASLRLTNTDEGHSDIQVTIWLESDGYDPAGLPVVTLDTYGAGADLAIQVPSGMELLDIGSINGDLEVDVQADRLFVDTTNGDIDVTASARHIDLDTTNGDITLQGSPTGSGEWVLDSTNGDIEATVATGSRIGYDITVDTTNGDVTVEVEDTVQEDEDHYRTRAFQDRAIRVRLDADTTNGDVTISG